MSGEFCIFHLELEEEEHFVQEYSSSSELDEDEFINVIRSTIRNGEVVIIRFDTNVKNYGTFINNIGIFYSVYEKILQPVLEDVEGDFEIFFSLLDEAIFVEVLNGIIVVRDSIISMNEFENFCHLVREIAYFMVQ